MIKKTVHNLKRGDKFIADNGKEYLKVMTSPSIPSIKGHSHVIRLEDWTIVLILSGLEVELTGHVFTLPETNRNSHKITLTEDEKDDLLSDPTPSIVPEQSGKPYEIEEPDLSEFDIVVEE